MSTRSLEVTEVTSAEKEASDKLAAEAKAKADADAAEIARVKAELKAKEEAEALAHEQELKRIADEELDRIAKEKSESLAPDRDKINKMYTEIKNFQFPELSDPDAIQIVEEVKQGFEIILKGIVSAAKTLK